MQTKKFQLCNYRQKILEMLVQEAIGKYKQIVSLLQYLPTIPQPFIIVMSYKSHHEMNEAEETFKLHLFRIVSV